jgi:glycosyltransferase involved in cell wall biosynthesis
MPSRSEGLPLVLLEAMAAGRPVIITNAGGNAEVVKDGETGFISEISFSSLDAALEKAWAHRHQWEQMGKNAFQFIDQYLPAKPEADFANLVTELIYE